MTEHSACPICGFKESGVVRDWISEDNSDMLMEVTCDRCGRYVIPRMLASDIRHWRTKGNLQRMPTPYPIDQWHLISGRLRQLSLSAGRSPRLSEESIQTIVDAAPTRVGDKLSRLLINLGAMTSEAGEELDLNKVRDYPLGFCKNAREFAFLLQHLADAGSIELRVPEQSSGAVVTVDGWSEIQALEATMGASRQVFIALSFDDHMLTTYERAIRPAVVESGYMPLMMGELEHADRIDERIEVELRKSIAVVADFTHQKHGVYFEAGFARGRGVPVIWMCHDDDKGNLHFDTREYNHILWKSEIELKERLQTRLTVLLG
ncbi:MAG: hypothetical protein WD942_00625 [Dehalococcoidia bacterium]